MTKDPNAYLTDEQVDQCARKAGLPLGWRVSLRAFLRLTNQVAWERPPLPPEAKWPFPTGRTGTE